MSDVGHKIKRRVIILAVLFLFPSVGLSSVIDLPATVDGKRSFQSRWDFTGVGQNQQHAEYVIQ